MRLWWAVLAVFAVLAWRASATSTPLHDALARMAASPARYHTQGELDACFRILATGSGQVDSAACPRIVEAAHGAGNGPPCPYLRVSSTASEPALTVLRFRKGSPGRHAMLLFGEHARELVSPETALALAEALCLLDPNTVELAAEVLGQYEVVLVPLANPVGHQQVFDGEFCKRTNENGVDLNRNWASHWRPAGAYGGTHARTRRGATDTLGCTRALARCSDSEVLSPETNSGTAPFSEPETVALRALMDDVRPFFFTTVHSGTLGMYSPFAYSTSLPPNHDAMLSVLEAVNPEVCNCPVGAAGKQVGYLCPGTCLDYAYERDGARFAFAVEIFSGEEAAAEMVAMQESDLWSLRRPAAALQSSVAALLAGDGAAAAAAAGEARSGSIAALMAVREADTVASSESMATLREQWQQQQQQQQRRRLLAPAKFGSRLRGSGVQGDRAFSLPPHESCFLQEAASVRAQAQAAISPRECLALFNPITAPDLQRVSHSWARALLRMAQLSAQHAS